jgi:hypothetical protein
MYPIAELRRVKAGLIRRNVPSENRSVSTIQEQIDLSHTYVIGSLNRDG